MNIVDPSIDHYLGRLAESEDPVLREMEQFAAARSFPIVGPQVGRFLRILARSIPARRVLELGSGFGYSAYWFAHGVGAEGLVVLTERSAERAEMARSFLDRAGLGGRFRIEVGDALTVAGSLDGPFDIVFNDVDKERYPAVPELAARLLRPGGLLICDNMLWFGKVLQDGAAEPATRGVQELTTTLFESEAFETTLLPLRDGVTISIYRG